MSPPQVTVVIPTRNRLPLLQQAVRSVLGQRGVDVECIVVDDCSDDGTHEWLASLRTTVSRSCGSRSTPSAPSRATSGCGVLTAPFVLFLDDDDTADLDSAAAATREAPGPSRRPSSASDGGLQIEENGDAACAPLPSRTGARSLSFGRPCSGSCIPGQASSGSRSSRTVGGWNEDMIVAEDQDLLMRVALKGPLVLVPQVTYVNRLHPGQETLRDDSMPAGAARQRLREATTGPLATRIDRYIDVRTRLLTSYDRYQAGHGFKALGLRFGAVGRDPGVLVDPLTRRGIGTYLLRCIVRSVPGSYAVARAARLTAASRNDR